MADIFDEINEDLRRDRASELWSKYGKYLIAIVVGIVLVVAGWQLLVKYQKTQTMNSANAFFAAIQADDKEAAIRGLDLPDGYEMLAEFRLASSFADDGKAEAASEAYLALADEDDIDQIYRDIALLLSVQTAPKNASARELSERIAEMASEAGPLQALALETMAGLALRVGDISGAKESLRYITQLNNVSAVMRQRSGQMLRVLEGGAVQ